MGIFDRIKDGARGAQNLGGKAFTRTKELGGKAYSGAKGLGGKAGRGAMNVPSTVGAGFQAVKESKVGKGVGLVGSLAVGASKLGHHAIGKSQGVWILIFPFFLWLFDLGLGINGIEWGVFLTRGGTDILSGLFFGLFWELLVDTTFLLFLGIYLILRWPRSKEEWIFPIIMIFLFALIWSVGKSNLWVFYHLAFAFFVFVFLLKGFDRDIEIGISHWIFLFIIVWDIFAFPSIGLLIPDSSDVLGIEVLDVFTNSTVKIDSLSRELISSI